MLTNNLAAGQVPRGSPPPPPPPPRPQSGVQHTTAPPRPPRPPPHPKPSLLQETIYELPADTIRVEDGPFEVAAVPLSAESQFDDQLQRNYVTYSGHEAQNDRNNLEGHLDWSDSPEQPLPPIPLYVWYPSFPKTENNFSSLTRIAKDLRIPLKCRSCHRTTPSILELVFCRGCRHSFHPGCWDDYEDHVPSEYTPEPCSGYTRLDLHVWVSHLHTSQNEEFGLLQDLVNDRYHRWIGTPQTASGEALEPEQPELMLYPTLARQFNEFFNVKPATADRMPRTQYPRLVAFFGDTGMGKSTIIKNLVRHLTSSKAFDVPIVGSRAEAQNSTSAGVHIYMDPDTFRHERPIVYVGM